MILWGAALPAPLLSSVVAEEAQSRTLQVATANARRAGPTTIFVRRCRLSASASNCS